MGWMEGMTALADRIGGTVACEQMGVWQTIRGSLGDVFAYSCHIFLIMPHLADQHLHVYPRHAIFVTDTESGLDWSRVLGIANSSCTCLKIKFWMVEDYGQEECGLSFDER
jgi:hypothetical protein